MSSPERKNRYVSARGEKFQVKGENPEYVAFINDMERRHLGKILRTRSKIEDGRLREGERIACVFPMDRRDKDYYFVFTNGVRMIGRVDQNHQSLSYVPDEQPLTHPQWFSVTQVTDMYERQSNVLGVRIIAHSANQEDEGKLTKGLVKAGSAAYDVRKARLSREVDIFSRQHGSNGASRIQDIPGQYTP